MKNNKYTRALSSIEISEAALENGLRYAKEKEERVINMTKNRKAYWKTAAVAASLAVIIGVGGVIGHNFSAKPENSFIISANADELTADSLVQICEMHGIGGGVGGARNDKDMSVQNVVNFPVFVEGENISTVTYSVIGDDGEDLQLFLVISPTLAEVSENDASEVYGNHWMFKPYMQGVTEYTVAYGDQADIEQFQPFAMEKTMENDKITDTNEYFKADAEIDPVVLSFYFNFSFDEFGIESVDNMYEEAKANHLFDKMEELFEQSSEDMCVNVSVKFNDGTVQSKKIQLYYDIVDDFNVLLSARLIEEPVQPDKSTSDFPLFG